MRKVLYLHNRKSKLLPTIIFKAISSLRNESIEGSVYLNNNTKWRERAYSTVLSRKKGRLGHHLISVGPYAITFGHTDIDNGQGA